MEININENTKKGKGVAIKRLFWPIIVILVGTGAYGVMKLVNIEKNRVPVTVEYPKIATSTNITPSFAKPQDTPLKIRGDAETTSTGKVPALPPHPFQGEVPKAEGVYEAARGGTVYYLPTCSGAKKIAEKNKIWFDSKAEADKFGYKPAKNCKGL